MNKPIINPGVSLLLLLTFIVLTSSQAQQSTKATSAFNVVATYTIPGKASGLAFDGTNLYSGIYGSAGDEIYIIDTATGGATFLCSGPMGDSYGLTFDGQNLWTTDHNAGSQPAWAVQFDVTGAELDTFELMTTYMSGIAYDNGNFWVAAYYNPDGHIYKINPAGNVMSQFPSPYAQPWDLCLENGNLWIVDYYNNSIDKMDSTGVLLESNPSFADRPAGIVFDGKYLWYTGGPLNDSSTLFKVDIGSGPGPLIFVPDEVHDFGDVLVGDSATWDAKVMNLGSLDLIVDSLLFPYPVSPLYSPTSLPLTIPPGDSAIITFIFKPTTSGLMSEDVPIQSNSGGAIIPLFQFSGNGTTVGFHNVNKRSNVSVYPNPFSNTTIIKFSLDEPMHVSVRVYNMIGGVVRVLRERMEVKGDKMIVWNGRNSSGILLTEGIYFCVIRIGDDKVVEKIVIQ